MSLRSAIRDPRSVSAGALFPAIAAVVPGVTHGEIITALQQTADQAIEEARKLFPHIKAERPSYILNLVIHAPDRAALAIAYAQGLEAGTEARGTPEDVPEIYRTATDRLHEAAGWHHGHIQGGAIRRIVDQAADDCIRRGVKAGEIINLGNDRFVGREYYKPEIHGPAVPYRRAKRAPRSISR